MAIALISSGHTATNGANNITTSAIDTTGATLLVLYLCEQDSATDATVSDSKSNTWTALTSQSDPALSNLLGRMFYATNVSGKVGSGHTFTITSSSGGPAVCVAAFSGTHTTAPLDQQNGKEDHDAGLSNTTNSITPSEANCLVITGLGFYGNSATISIDGSYTIIDQVDQSGSIKGAALAYAVQAPGPAASDRTWSYSSNEYAVTTIASFKSDGGAPPPTTSRDITTLLCGN